MIKSFIEQLKNFVSSEECSIQDVGGILKHYILELISAMTSTNLKIREIAKEIYTDICTLMRCKFNAVNQLFTIILVGLTGTHSSTKSAAIRSLIFTIKRNIQFNKQVKDKAEEDQDMMENEKPEQEESD